MKATYKKGKNSSVPCWVVDEGLTKINGEIVHESTIYFGDAPEEVKKSSEKKKDETP